jgi:hypothetical protein
MPRHPSFPAQRARNALPVRACERLSRVGIWLVPAFYVSYFLALALACRTPAATLWLLVGGAALAVAMGLLAIVFSVASHACPNPKPSAAALLRYQPQRSHDAP